MDESSTSTLTETPTTEVETSSGPSSFFSRVQASLPPNVVSAVQRHIPESIRHASEGGVVDLGQLRTSLVGDFQRVQGVTRAQAEEYYYKSEALLREAVKEAGEVLKDAVKVVPPEEGLGSTTVVWDGSDVWMVPCESAADVEGRSSSSSSRSGGEPLTAAAVATRAEALLRRLKRDGSILRRDPEEEDVKAEFLLWREREVDSEEGGIEGAEWSSRIGSAVEEPVDGEALKELENSLGKFIEYSGAVLMMDLNGSSASGDD